MTLVSDIIQQAYRDANLITIGNNPTANESTEALKRLQVLILSTLGTEAGEQLSALPVGNNNVSQPDDWVPDPPEFLPPNVRLVCNLQSATTLYMPPNPQDGARLAVIDASANFATHNLTLNGNGRKVDGGTTDVLSTNSQAIQYIYRADIGDWKAFATLATSDEMPFPEEFDDLFIGKLALRLAPRNSAPYTQEQMASMEEALEKFRARYSQTVPTPCDIGVLNLGRTTGRGGNVFSGF